MYVLINNGTKYEQKLENTLIYNIIFPQYILTLVRLQYISQIK